MKQLLIILFISFFSVNVFSQSGMWSFVSQQDPQAKVLVNALEKDNLKLALQKWSSVSSGFEKSSTGIALYAYLLFHNDMPLSGVELLIKEKNPRAIHPVLKAEWKQMVPPDHWMWNIVSGKLTKSWNSVFNVKLIGELQAIQFKGIRSNKKAKKLYSYYKKLTKLEDKRALAWPLFLWFAASRNEKISLSLAKEIKKYRQDLIGADRINLNLGRLYYQLKKFKTALKYYGQVSADSDFWLESLEEQAWSYLSLKEPQKALAKLKTIEAPLFQYVSQPDSYYLSSYISLKLCEYQRVFSIMTKFKKTFRTSLLAMDSLSKNGLKGKSRKAFDKYLRSGLKWEKLGKDLAYLPRLFFRDKLIVSSLRNNQQRIEETDLLKSLIKKNPKSKMAALMYQHMLAQKVNFSFNEKIAENRIKVLADNFLKHMEALLPKMHIIDAETIPRLYTHDFKGKEFKGKYQTKHKKQKNELIFVSSGEDEEVWLDELDSYQVDAKGCKSSKEIM